MNELGYFVGAAVLVMAVLVIRMNPPSSRGVTEILDWRLTRSAELEAELEINDVAQMLAAQNARRRARGDRERSLEDVERDVAVGLRAQIAPSADAKTELAQMLALTNARRRERGIELVTLEQLRGELGA